MESLVTVGVTATTIGSVVQEDVHAVQVTRLAGDVEGVCASVVGVYLEEKRKVKPWPAL